MLDDMSTIIQVKSITNFTLRRLYKIHITVDMLIHSISGEL